MQSTQSITTSGIFPEEIGVLDASVVSVSNIIQIMQNRQMEYKKIVITGITSYELNALKERRWKDNANVAQSLLKVIETDKSEYYIHVSLERTKVFEKDDEYDNDWALIRFCREEKYSLITADFGMSARARCEGVKVTLLEQENLDRFQDIELRPYFEYSVKQDENVGIFFRGNLTKRQQNLNEGDEVFIISKEKNHKGGIVVFQNVVIKDSVRLKGKIKKKIIFGLEDRVNLYNYAPDEAQFLEKEIETLQRRN